MSKDSITAEVYRCDAIGCDVVRIVEQGDLPEGFHGTVFAVDAYGQPTGDATWYACEPAHVQSAVQEAVKREHEAH